jgi:hypothetical protein
MKRFGLAVALSGLLLVGNAAPAAARATNDHETFTDTFTDPDFCGTGVPIDSTVTVMFTDHFGPGDVFRSTVTGKQTFTNPANGASVVLSFANLVTDELVSGDVQGSTREDPNRQRSGHRP